MTGPEALICQEASHGYTIIRRRRSFPRRGRSLGFGYHDHAGANPWRNALASYFGDALSSPPLPPPHMTCGGKPQQQARHFEKTEEVHSQILQFPLLETSHRKRQAFANFPRGALLRKHRKCAWVVFSYARHPFGIVFPSFVFCSLIDVVSAAHEPRVIFVAWNMFLFLFSRISMFRILPV